jgi:hypothetical protein
MSVLIIHPQDSSTDFKPIYTPISDKTVITGGVSKSDLMKLIENHDRIIMLGHGSPWGLMSVGQFNYGGNYIVDLTMVELLSMKKDNIYIWCNADQFVLNNRLNGFYSGMFISEVEEAFYYNIWDIEWETIDESNNKFSEIVSRYINEPLAILYKNVIQQYGLLSQNPIVRFNLERLYFNSEIKKINSICNTKLI